MDAGRDIDKLIAEKVFGYKVIHLEADDQWVEGDGYYAAPPDLAQEIWDHKASGYYTSVILKPYSTDIAAAWQVVEKMRGDYVATIEDHIMSWSVSFVRLRGFGIMPTKAPTAPHAICLAALAALGVEP